MPGMYFVIKASCNPLMHLMMNKNQETVIVSVLTFASRVYARWINYLTETFRAGARAYKKEYIQKLQPG